MASVRCLDDALGFTGYGTGARQMPQQGRILRNLIEGFDMVMSHILHFYHLAALDYINTDTAGCIIANTSPWSPRDSWNTITDSTTVNVLVGQYVTALNIRRKAHEAAAYIDGKHPCQAAFIPGGVTKTVDANLATNLQTILGGSSAALTATSIRSFIKNVYIPTVVTVAKAYSGSLLVGSAASGVGKGCGNYLSYGTFPDSSGVNLIKGGFAGCSAATTAGWVADPLNAANIAEFVKYSYYDDGSGAYDGLHPSVGVTKPSAGKSGAYSWLKAPRYFSGSGYKVAEVGPLARVMNNYLQEIGVGGPFTTTVNQFITGTLGLTLSVALPALRSVLGRHAARALECNVIADAMTGWISSLSTTTATGQTYRHRNIPRISTGAGLTEAPRGALGHWIRIDGKKVSNYQCVVPTTWNAGPKDTAGNMGPIEQAINGTAWTSDPAGRTRIGRIIRSFDPCIACAVHMVKPNGEVVKFDI
jgi:hydrogenase large subunit